MMQHRYQIWPLLALAGLLAACGTGAGPDEGEGEALPPAAPILQGTISDEMIGFERLQSRPPIEAPRAAPAAEAAPAAGEEGGEEGEPAGEPSMRSPAAPGLVPDAASAPARSSPPGIASAP